MKRILFIFCSTLIVASCNTKQTNSKETAHDFGNDQTTLYVVTIKDPELDSTHVKKLNELPLVKVSKNRPSPVTANHLEISLNLLADGSGYLAQRHVTEPGSDSGNAKNEYITEDWCSSNRKIFKTTADFLNFISEHGYKLASQAENGYGKEYVFNRL